MKIAVIGKNGQLATCLKEVAPSELDITFYGSDELDILGELLVSHAAQALTNVP